MNASFSLCSALLGLFLVVPLLALSRRRRANFWLAAFVYSVSSLALADYCGQAHVYSRYPILLGMFDWPVVGLGATYYLYVCSISGGVRRRQLWHFAPMLLWAGWLLHIRLTVPDAVLLDRLAHAQHAGFKPELLVFQLIVAGYAVAALRRLHRYQAAVRSCYSNTAGRDLNWLRWLTWAMCLQFMLWLPVNGLGPDWVMVFCVSRLLMLYLLGWFGMRQPAVFLDALREDAAQPAPLAPATAGSPPAGGEHAPSAPSAKYARSGMTEATRSLIGQRLARQMQEGKVHQRPDLTLADLADKIGTSPQLLSQYLNDVLGVSFFDYVNRARVATVRTLMMDASLQHHTLLDLALMAGFNSKTAFNNSFKRETGMTPSAWKKQGPAKGAPIGEGDVCGKEVQAGAVVS
ncbi:MAG: helix-turn-helix transcriptional regulator [Burkholderiales bacterium]|nr:helix-turn-helix transcriptional regulator [Burkholderiales bacterium]